MAVISIAELKARFVTGDRPSQKDWDDMIDTLLAGSGSAVPSGPAGGDLGGTYPNPTIPANTVTFAKMQQLAGQRLLGRYSPGAGNIQDILIGTGLTLAANTLSAVPSGGGGTPPPGTVSGGINTYDAPDEPIPAVEGFLPDIQAPVEFGSTLPQHIQVTAVCVSGFASYLAGDEVPLDHFRLNADPEAPAFTWYACVDGGRVTVRVKVEFGDVAGAPPDGIAVYDRDSSAGAAPTLVPFASPGSMPGDSFEIRVRMARFEFGSGFGSLVLFEPADQALPAAAAVATFTHNYQAIPSLPVLVDLVCITDESAVTGHAVGDAVPIYAAFEAAFANPAFGVTSTTSTILVRREATTIQIPHKTTGTLTTLTDARWQLRVRTARGVNLPSITFPSTSFQVTNPECAWTYGNLLYVVHYDYGLAKSFLSRIDMTNNNVTALHEFSPNINYGNASMFRLTKSGVPTDCVFITSNGGIHRIDMDDESVTRLTTGNWYPWKVLEVDDDGGTDFAYPEMFACISEYGHRATTNSGLQAVVLTHNGVSYIANYSGGNVDWSALPGVGGPYSQYQMLDQQAHSILLFQYNPIRRRIYMIHNGSGYLNMFSLAPGENMFSWWTASPDGGDLTFEKMLVVPGGEGYWVDTHAEHYFVEYDGLTGAEKAVVFIRKGHGSLAGSVWRVPWME